MTTRITLTTSAYGSSGQLITVLKYDGQVVVKYIYNNDPKYISLLEEQVKDFDQVIDDRTDKPEQYNRL